MQSPYASASQSRRCEPTDGTPFANNPHRFLHHRVLALSLEHGLIDLDVGRGNKCIARKWEDQ